MLEEKDLQAIAEIMQGMESRIDQKMEKQKQEIMSETKGLLAQQKQEILDESTRRMKLLLDTEVTAKFNLLAEGQQAILEKLVPMSRSEAVEADIAILKQAVRAMNQEIDELKKAQ